MPGLMALAQNREKPEKPNWMRKFPHIVRSNENYVTAAPSLTPPLRSGGLMLMSLPLGWHSI